MSVTGIVLAGGRATRFGGPKLAAELNGRSILDLAIVALSDVVDEILVAGPEALNLPELEELVERPGLARRPDARPRGDVGLRIVADAAPFAGPLAALEGALGEARGDIAVVVGGDMPRLVPNVLRSMVAHLMAAPTLEAVLLGSPGATPDAAGRTEQRRQVLPVVLGIGAASTAARAALDAGDRSLRALLDRLASEEIPPERWLLLDPAATTLRDVDTRADLDRLQAPGSAREVP